MDELKKAIKKEALALAKDTDLLKKVCYSVTDRIHECIEADGGNFEQNHWLTLWLILTIFLNLVIWNFLLSLVMNCVLSWCTPYCEWFLGFRKKSGWNWGNDRCTKLFRVKKNTLYIYIYSLKSIGYSPDKSNFM